MTDPRMSNLARLLVQYSVAVQPGEFVNIRYFGSIVAGMPMIAEVFREVLRAGGNPHIQVHPAFTEEIGYLFLKEATDDQISFVDPTADLLVKEVDCEVAIACDTNTLYLAQIDPERHTLRRMAAKELTELLWERWGRGELRWVYSGFPSTGQAQDAEMSLEEYGDFVYAATCTDTEDAVDKWNAIREYQERLVTWLDRKEMIVISGDGVDLEMSMKGRKFINCCGKVNMPDGEIFTGPVETSVNGRVKFSYPCIWSGIEVNGVDLTFEQGKVVEARAEKNEAFLLETLKTDAGASYLGELGIGTNNQIDRFTGNMLFDEKMAGTIHLALGRGIPESGSKNKSAIHWDLLTDMRNGGTITVDGELFYESGQFKI